MASLPPQVHQLLDAETMNDCSVRIQPNPVVGEIASIRFGMTTIQTHGPTALDLAGRLEQMAFELRMLAADRDESTQKQWGLDWDDEDDAKDAA